MIKEVQEAKKYFAEKYNGNTPSGTYAVPTRTSKGEAFLRVDVDVFGYFSNFELFTDEKLTKSWYEKKSIMERCFNLFRGKANNRRVSKT